MSKFSRGLEGADFAVTKKPGDGFLMGHPFCNSHVFQSTEKRVTWSNWPLGLGVDLHDEKSVAFLLLLPTCRGRKLDLSVLEFFTSNCFYLQTNRTWRA